MEETIKILAQFTLMKDLLESTNRVIEYQYTKWVESQRVRKTFAVGARDAEFQSSLIPIQSNLVKKLDKLRHELAANIGIDLIKEMEGDHEELREGEKEHETY